MNLSYNKIKLLFVIWNEIFINHRVVPNDSNEHLLSQQYFKNTIPVIPLLPSSDELIEV
jgi:hypothetical protein